MANQVGVFANIRTFLEEGKKGFFFFFPTRMKYTLCKHRNQLETKGVSRMRNVHIPHG